MTGYAQVALLALLVLACWLGCLGMIRMKTPTQALHYLALPSVIGTAILPLAVFCVAGWSVAVLKAALIALFLIASNSAVAHATARAFRVRSAGHWEPQQNDRIEFVEIQEKAKFIRRQNAKRGDAQ